MPRINGGAEEWLYSGLRVTDADNNDIDQAPLIFAALGQGPVTGATVFAMEDDAAGQAFTPTTNSEGIPPRFWLPSPDADASADGGVTWFSIGTVERAAERQAVLDAAAAAEAASASAAGAQEAAQQSATTVAGFNTRLTAAEQEAARIGPAVTQAQTAASQAVQASNAVATFEARIAALEAGGGGTGGTGGGDLKSVRTVNGQWEYASLAEAEADGYVAGEQVLVFLGTASGPDWAPLKHSVFLRNSTWDLTA